MVENLPSFQQLTDNVIEKLNNGKWGPFADLINDCNTNNKWSENHSSFSAWIDFIVNHYKISKARCWRYKKAGEYYNSLREKDKALPPLYDLPSHISAESLEILERIERIAPAKETETLKTQILNGDAPIRVVKQTWKAYKPALQGETKRGRGKQLTAMTLSDKEKFETDCYLALANSYQWLSSTKPARKVVYRNVEDKKNKHTYDYLVLVQKHLDSDVEVHAIETKLNTRETLDEIASKSGYIDYAWHLEASHINPFNKNNKQSGSLKLSDNVIVMSSEAHRIDSSVDMTFYKEILKLALIN